MSISASSISGNKYASIVKEAIDSHSESLRDLSLQIQIHSNLELGNEEVFAHKILTDYLEENGFNVTRHAYGINTAFVAEYESPAAAIAIAAGQKVKTVGFCSEYDALPGMGHAFKAALEKGHLVGRVRLLGTPAEETTGGKVVLIEKGAFDGLDACMMTHPSPADSVYSTVLAAAGIHSFLNIAGKIIYRSINSADHAKLYDDIYRILNAAAESTGCTVKITKEMEYKSLPVNELLASRYTAYTMELGVKYIPRKMQETAPGASTDMGNVAHYCPAIHPGFNIMNLESVIDTSVSNHTIEFTAKAKTEVAHLAVLRSTKGLALTGLDVLVEEGFAEAVREDFERRVPKERVHHQ
ncbi:hypothetical protein BGX28_005793 [Mortierella sp. GBA30]|nr:hypothetical protein BGX28_005793 [Mortierella sp. GBA30]